MPKPKRLLGRESAPFGQRIHASLFVDFAGDEMTFLVEMIVDLSINRAEFLKRLRASEPLHGSLSSSKRLMRVFRPIVEATTNLVAFDVANLAHRGGIGGKPVGDDAPRPAIFLHDPLQKLRRRGLVPLRGDHCFQNLAFVIDSPPEMTPPMGTISVFVQDLTAPRLGVTVGRPMTPGHSASPARRNLDPDVRATTSLVQSPQICSADILSRLRPL